MYLLPLETARAFLIFLGHHPRGWLIRVVIALDRKRHKVLLVLVQVLRGQGNDLLLSAMAEFQRHRSVWVDATKAFGDFLVGRNRRTGRLDARQESSGNDVHAWLGKRVMVDLSDCWKEIELFVSINSLFTYL